MPHLNSPTVVKWQEFEDIRVESVGRCSNTTSFQLAKETHGRVNALSAKKPQAHADKRKKLRVHTDGRRKKGHTNRSRARAQSEHKKGRLQSSRRCARRTKSHRVHAR